MDKKLLLNKHMKQVWQEQRVYYKHRNKARRFLNKYLTIIDDGMDQKTTNIPRVRRKTKATCNLTYVGTHLIGAILHNGQAAPGKEMYGSFDFYKWKHGPNRTASVLLRVIETWCRLYKLPPILYLQLDNCVKLSGVSTPGQLNHSATRRLRDTSGAATTAPRDDTPEEDDATDADGALQCPECPRAFVSMRGLSQHRRHRHPIEYHRGNIPTARQKARWDQEELILLARSELRLLDAGVKNINQRLVGITPGGTLGAIKGVRRGRAYREVLDLLRLRSDSTDEYLERCWTCFGYDLIALMST
ncbi:hypothetical protein ACROYT_G015159 [Oculina patagonica]